MSDMTLIPSGLGGGGIGGLIGSWIGNGWGGGWASNNQIKTRKRRISRGNVRHFGAFYCGPVQTCWPTFY